MTDALLRIRDHRADLVVENGDVVLDEGLATAVLISLFSDMRTPEELVEEGVINRHGFWAEATRDPWGSLLYTNYRGKADARTAESDREAASDALRWLIDERILQAVNVEVEVQAGERIAVRIGLVRGSATRWPQVWAATQSFNASVLGFEISILPL